MPGTNTVRFPTLVLETFISTALHSLDMSENDANDCARLMVASDKAGFHTHGIFRLAQYVKRIKAGGINVKPSITIVSEAPATALVDGDNAMGHLVAEFSMNVAIQKAEETGCAWVGVRHSNHAGAAATYVAMAAEKKMIALYGTNGSANHMAPWGSADLLLGTNPIAAAMPTNVSAPILMDIATSVTSFGKVRTAAQRGEDLPPDWMFGRDGEPIINSSRYKEGILNPIGGHKGYALSLIIGLLAATLSGAQMGVDVETMGDEEYQKNPVNNGHFMVVVDPSRFGETSDFGNRVEEVANTMRAAAPMPGVENVRVPGDGRAKSISDSEKHGVPVHEALLSNLNKLADELHISSLAK